MENKIVKEDFSHLNFTILLSVKELRNIPTNYDDAGQKSLLYLTKIVQAPNDKFIQNLDNVYQDVLKNHFAQSALRSETGHLIMLYQIIWARMIVISYYYYHSDEKWIKKGIPLMEKHIHHEVLEKGIKKGMQLVDEYYQLCEDWEKSDTPDDTQQHEAKVPTFHIAENRKTDVIKVFSYMFDEDLFVNADGSPLKRQKTQFMKALGEFFGDNFANYARTINKAAQEPNFPRIFESMLMRSKEKYVYTK